MTDSYTAQPLPHRADRAVRARALTAFRQAFAAAISGGDVASVILPANGMDEAAFQAFAERIVPHRPGGRHRGDHRRGHAHRRPRRGRRHPHRGGKAELAEAIEQLPAEDDGRRGRRQDPRRRAGARRGAAGLHFLRPFRLRQRSPSRTTATWRSAHGGPR